MYKNFKLQTMLSKAIIIFFTLVFTLQNTTLAKADVSRDITANKFVQEFYLNNDNTKYYLIILFASWCSYCKRSIPEIYKMEEKYKGQLKIALVSLDQEEERFDDFIIKFENSPFSKLKIYKPYSNDDTLDIIDFFHINYSDRIPHFTLLKKENNEPIIDGPISVSVIDRFLSEKTNLEANDTISSSEK